jgi:hypothetical protein
MNDLQFKTHEIAHNFCDVKIHPKLTDLLLWIMEYTGEIVVTSARRYRTIHKKDSGIHLTDPLRAADLRSYIYNDAGKLAENINSNWQYDWRRGHLRCAVEHNTGLGRHLHIQIHERTKRKDIT